MIGSEQVWVLRAEVLHRPGAQGLLEMMPGVVHAELTAREGELCSRLTLLRRDDDAPTALLRLREDVHELGSAEAGQAFGALEPAASSAPFHLVALGATAAELADDVEPRDWHWQIEPHSCQHNVLPVVRGLPGPDLFRAAKEGRVILGGCNPLGPNQKCRVCGHSWSVPRRG